MRISIIIPVLNDVEALKVLLPQLAPYKLETIVVDGGSRDSPELVVESFAESFAEGFDLKYVISEPGRAKQMNIGAAKAQGEVLLFLHGDSLLPNAFDKLIKHAMNHAQWGRFDVRLSGSQPMFRVIEWMMNHRSRLTGICTGDQGIFVQAEVFRQQGGFPNIPIMEDIELSKSMPSAPYCIRPRLTTSSRRWEQNGIWKTIILMWTLRLRYFLGARPAQLVKQYYG
ncbi:MAG: rSAM/selenodomain-associated transferase 2 [Candidatus Azotimanducaceae bacterium]|jgi:rSAM/selenodomain-associated transferase 2